MKTYIAADLHLGYDWTAEEYQRIWNFQSLVTPEDTVIYAGDTYEWVWRRKEEVAQTEEYHKFISNLRGDNHFIEGNHNPGDGSAYWVSEDLIVCHGHQFDRMADTAWKRFYYRFAPYVRDMWRESPFKQKIHGRKDWQLHNAQIWSSAISWLESSDYQILVIGHTHDSCVIERPELDKKLVSIGSLAEDGVYAEIVDGQVIIKKLPVR